MTAKAHSSSSNKLSLSSVKVFRCGSDPCHRPGQAIPLRTWTNSVPSSLASMPPAILSCNTTTRFLFLEHLYHDQRQQWPPTASQSKLSIWRSRMSSLPPLFTAPGTLVSLVSWTFSLLILSASTCRTIPQGLSQVLLPLTVPVLVTTSNFPHI